MAYGTPTLRKILKAYYRDHKEASDRWWNKGRCDGPKADVPYPEECRGMMCGAKTRSGKPCKQTNIFDNGRCKFHGGMSTGPTTPEGRRQSAINGRQGKDKTVEAFSAVD